MRNYWVKRSGVLVRAVVTLLFLSLMETSGEARVFLLAGQSNMAGAGLFDQLKKSEQKAPEGVKIWHKNQWQEVGPGVSANEGRFGPELAFGRAMRKAFPEDAIYLINTAAGGTSMHKHWNVENGTMRKRFLATVRAALKNLDKSRAQYEEIAETRLMKRKINVAVSGVCGILRSR
jgi:hypothetical protein